MQCKNCGKELSEGFAFCDNCGAPVIKENPVEVKTDVENNPEAKNPSTAQFATQSVAQQPYYENQPMYNQPQSPQPTYSGKEYQATVQSNIQPVTTIGQYIVWILIGFLIPVAALVLAIIDSSNKNRANFFRALLIIDVGVLVLALFIAIAFGSTIASLF